MDGNLSKEGIEETEWYECHGMNISRIRVHEKKIIIDFKNGIPEIYRLLDELDGEKCDEMDICNCLDKIQLTIEKF